MKLAIAAVFPVPEFHALACPVCNQYKMYPENFSGIEGYRCAGRTCQHFMDKIAAESFIGMMMVEE